MNWETLLANDEMILKKIDEIIIDLSNIIQSNKVKKDMVKVLGNNIVRSEKIIKLMTN